MYGPTGIFWLCLFGVLLVAGREALLPLFHPEKALALPFLSSAIWLYFYGFMAIKLVSTSLIDLLPMSAFAFGQLLALIALISLLAGWYLGLKRAKRELQFKKPTASFREKYDPRRVWLCAMIVIAVGTISHYFFRAQENINYAESSAYWYLSFHLLYPGLVLAILCLKLVPTMRSTWRISFVAVAALGALAPHIIALRRGPLFPAVVIATFLPFLLNRKVRLSVVFGSCAGAGFCMLLFLPLRHYTYNGAAEQFGGTISAIEAGMTDVTLDDVINSRTEKASDNEYLYHCASVWAMYDLGMYQYGTAYINLLGHWIPREWWPNKPGLGIGWFDWIVPEMYKMYNWDISSGASFGGVASSFEQLGFLFVLLWYFLGRWSARFYYRAWHQYEVTAMVIYIGILSTMLWFISQSLFEAIVPGCAYILVPIAILKISERRRELAYLA